MHECVWEVSIARVLKESNLHGLPLCQLLPYGNVPKVIWVFLINYASGKVWKSGYLLLRISNIFFHKSKFDLDIAWDIVLFHALVQREPLRVVFWVVVVSRDTIRQTQSVAVKAVFEGDTNFTQKITTKSVLVPHSDVEEQRHFADLDRDVKFKVPHRVQILLDDLGCVFLLTIAWRQQRRNKRMGIVTLFIKDKPYFTLTTAYGSEKPVLSLQQQGIRKV